MKNKRNWSVPQWGATKQKVQAYHWSSEKDKKQKLGPTCESDMQKQNEIGPLMASWRRRCY